MTRNIINCVRQKHCYIFVFVIANLPQINVLYVHCGRATLFISPHQLIVGYGTETYLCKTVGIEISTAKLGASDGNRTHLIGLGSRCTNRCTTLAYGQHPKP